MSHQNTDRRTTEESGATAGSRRADDATRPEVTGDRKGTPSADEEDGDPVPDEAAGAPIVDEEDGDPVPDEAAEAPIADEESAIRGAIYGVLATLFEEPDPDTVAGLQSGEIGEQLADLVSMSDLEVTVPDLVPEDDETLLKARFNDLFAVGYPEPPVPRYESAYHSEGQWESINVDLSRAYDYFGVAVDQTEREHHDHLILELEFAGYLSRLAAVDDEPSLRRARRDFLDRHLEGLADGMDETIQDEVETGIYTDLVGFLATFVRADLAALDERVGRTEPGESAETGDPAS